MGLPILMTPFRLIFVGYHQINAVQKNMLPTPMTPNWIHYPLLAVLMALKLLMVANQIPLRSWLPECFCQLLTPSPHPFPR